MNAPRRGYPSAVTAAQWEVLAPFLTLMTELAPQRARPLQAAFDAVRDVVQSGAPGRMLPNDFPPWAAVDQQARRGSAAGGRRPARSSRSPTNCGSSSGR